MIAVPEVVSEKKESEGLMVLISVFVVKTVVDWVGVWVNGIPERCESESSVPVGIWGVVLIIISSDVTGLEVTTSKFVVVVDSVCPAVIELDTSSIVEL
jgi:hypothetical protein